MSERLRDEMKGLGKFNVHTESSLNRENSQTTRTSSRNRHRRGRNRWKKREGTRRAIADGESDEAEDDGKSMTVDQDEQEVSESMMLDG
jgi:hypothetical protein